MSKRWEGCGRQEEEDKQEARDSFFPRDVPLAKCREAWARWGWWQRWEGEGNTLRKH